MGLLLVASAYAVPSAFDDARLLLTSILEEKNGDPPSLCWEADGNDAVVTLGGSLGVLELNVMLPVMARNLLESIGILASAATLLSERCVSGITPNRKRCEELIEQSLAMVTPLAVKIGYDKAAEIAHEAYHSGRTIREILMERKILPPEEIEKILDPGKMV